MNVFRKRAGRFNTNSPKNKKPLLARVSPASSAKSLVFLTICTASTLA